MTAGEAGHSGNSSSAVTPFSLPVGSEGCRCIDPWEFNMTLNLHAPYGFEDGSGEDGGANGGSCSWQRILSTTGVRECYSRQYGSTGCARHDLNSTFECVAANPPDWCIKRWCWVNAQECDRPMEKSNFFPTVTTLIGTATEPLHFSYGTCGSLDTFSTDSDVRYRRLREYAARQRNGRLRIVFPNDSGNKISLVTVPPGQGVGGTNRSGSVVAFMDELMRRGAVPWEEVAISDASRAFRPTSSFTACVHEVAIGGADMCWANVWPTAERRQMAAFTSPLYTDRFFMIVKRSEGGSSVWASIMQPFEPFTPQLWLAIIVAFAFAGILVGWEHHVWFSSTGEKEGVVCARLLPESALRGLTAFIGEFGVLLEGEQKTSGSWLTTLLLGFTFMVLNTGYTAAVTTRLFYTSTTTVTNLEEAINSNYRFCVNADIQPVLIARHPGLGKLIVRNTGSGYLIDAIDADICDAAIYAEHSWRARRSFGLGEQYCETLVRLPEAITELSNAIPVRGEIEQAVSAFIRTHVETGRYVELEIEAFQNYTYGVCTETLQRAVRSVFGLGDLGSALLLLLVFAAVISPLVTIVGHRIMKRTDLVEKSIRSGTTWLGSGSWRASHTNRVENPARIEPHD